MKAFFGWPAQQAPAPAQYQQQVQRPPQQGERLNALLESRDKLIDRFCDSCEDIISREPSFEESVTVLSHLFPNQLLTAESVSPHTSFTDQGRCCAVNKRGKKQCANKSMSGSRFCKTHYDLINANPWSSTNW